MSWEDKRAQLIVKCEQIIKDKIALAQEELNSYTAQSKEETKSSAGDKYETGRAMIHLEKEKIASQLNESIKLQKVVAQLRYKNVGTGLGKLIVTDQGVFFIAVSLGLVTLAGVKYLVISPVAPLGRLLATSKVGGAVSFNGKTYQIEEIIS